MQQSILAEIEEFMCRTGLSAHRVGILLARNGKLIERLRAGGRIWPETEMAIRGRLEGEVNRRALGDTKGAA